MYGTPITLTIPYVRGAPVAYGAPAPPSVPAAPVAYGAPTPPLYGAPAPYQTQV